MSKTKQKNTVTVKLIGSSIGQTKSIKSTVRGLGLKKINSVSTLQDNSSTQGMIRKIPHLVKIINN